MLFKIRADCRGKMELKEQAIDDYRMFMQLQQRNELRNEFSSVKNNLKSNLKKKAIML